VRTLAGYNCGFEVLESCCQLATGDRESLSSVQRFEDSIDVGIAEDDTPN
jgi:hypothetical protein